MASVRLWKTMYRSRKITKNTTGKMIFIRSFARSLKPSRISGPKETVSRSLMSTGVSVLRHHRHVRQIIERLEIAQPANHVSRPAQFQYAATDFIRARLHPINDGGQRYAVREQFVGIDIHLVLAHEPADARHFGHAGNGCQLITQVPVLNISRS